MVLGDCNLPPPTKLKENRTHFLEMIDVSAVIICAGFGIYQTEESSEESYLSSDCGFERCGCTELIDGWRIFTAAAVPSAEGGRGVGRCHVF